MDPSHPDTAGRSRNLLQPHMPGGDWTSISAASRLVSGQRRLRTPLLLTRVVEFARAPCADAIFSETGAPA